MKRLATLTAIIALSTTSFALNAQPAKPTEKQAQRALELRQSVFKLIAFNNSPIKAMAKGKKPLDLDLAKTQATRVATLASMITDTYKLDTRSFTLDTESLNVIWEKPDAFAEKAQATVDTATAIANAAKSGDEKATLKAMKGIGKTCGGCHDEFRVE